MIAIALACRPEAAARGRADDRARRHDPGPDPEAASCGLQAELGMSVVLVTHDLGVIAPELRSRRRHVCRPHRRAGTGRAMLLREPRHAYTLRPARFRSARRSCAAPAAPDRRRAAGLQRSGRAAAASRRAAATRRMPAASAPPAADRGRARSPVGLPAPSAGGGGGRRGHDARRRSDLSSR